MSFEGLLSPLRRCLSFGRLLSFRLLSFWRIGISWIPFEILSFDKDISHVLMLLAIVIALFFFSNGMAYPCRFLKFKTKFAAECFGSVNFKN